MASPIRSVADLNPNANYTYADYLTWQFTEWVELLRGKLVRGMSPAPTTQHQRLVSNLNGLLYLHLRHRPCRVFPAPFDVRLTTQGPNAAAESIATVVQPGLCVICDSAKLDARGCVGAPDWIIEIISPDTAARDMSDKLRLYEENGVGEYWIVSPGEQNIAVFVLDSPTQRYRTIGDYAAPGLVPSHTLPDLVMEWAGVFAD